MLDAIAVIASETFTSVSAPIQYAAVTAYQGSAATLNFTLTQGILVDEDKEGEKRIKTSTILTNHKDVLFNREEIARIEVAQPRSKIIFSLDYQNKKVNLLLRSTRFGQVQYINPHDGNPQNWVFNALSGQVESRDQLFYAKWITDFNITYKFSTKLSISLGGNNIFNVYPDKHAHATNISNGLFPYSRRVQQFGVLGTYWFTKISIKV